MEEPFKTIHKLSCFVGPGHPVYLMNLKMFWEHFQHYNSDANYKNIHFIYEKNQQFFKLIW